jgi:hypothetical protein
MILDSEEQRQNLLQLIRMAPIQGPFEQVGPIMQAIGKLKEEIENAVVLKPGWTASVDKKED